MPASKPKWRALARHPPLARWEAAEVEGGIDVRKVLERGTPRDTVARVHRDWVASEVDGEEPHTAGHDPKSKPTTLDDEVAGLFDDRIGRLSELRHLRASWFVDSGPPAHRTPVGGLQSTGGDLQRDESCRICSITVSALRALTDCEAREAAGPKQPRPAAGACFAIYSLLWFDLLA
jgi:hypothetical protein